jgi:hypothetical protein
VGFLFSSSLLRRWPSPEAAGRGAGSLNRAVTSLHLLNFKLVCAGKRDRPLASRPPALAARAFSSPGGLLPHSPPQSAPVTPHLPAIRHIHGDGSHVILPGSELPVCREILRPAEHSPLSTALSCRAPNGSLLRGVAPSPRSNASPILTDSPLSRSEPEPQESGVPPEHQDCGELCGSIALSTLCGESGLTTGNACFANSTKLLAKTPTLLAKAFPTGFPSSC